MTDSGAVQDSLLEGFSKPWPRPSSASGGSSCSELNVVGGEGGRPAPRLRLPKGVRLEDAVQVWNAMCVFPRPMGIRPLPTLEALMEAIEALSPKSSKVEEEGAGATTVRGGTEVSTEGGAAVEASAMSMNQLHETPTATMELEDDDSKEAEFDDKEACIRATGCGGAGNGQGRGKGGEDGGAAVEDKDVAKKEAQAMVDKFCMAIVRMLVTDMHTVLGR